MFKRPLQSFLSKYFSLAIIGAFLLSTFSSCSEDELEKKPVVITSFTPNKGAPGTIVTVIGEHFNANPNENTVTISGIAATVSEATTTTLLVTVPQDVTTGKIEVTANGFRALSSADFIVQPVISSFAPANAVAGSSIVISGTGFSATAANNLVTFNGKTAPIIQASANSLTVTAPPDGATGKITVSVGGESATSVQDFVYLPAITLISPIHGSINTEITINGSGFKEPANENQVLFNGTTAQVISGTTTKLVVKVPVNATTGPITVTSGANSVIGNSFNVVVEAVRMAGSGFETGYAIALDGSGNTYITGSFQGTITLGSTQLVAEGPGNIFVAKYNSNSELVWAKRAGGTGASRGNGIVVDDAGNSYITGYFTGDATFGSFTASSVGGSYDSYMAKLNAAGDFQWVKSFGSSITDMSYEIILDHEQNLVVVGDFFQTITIGTTDLTSVGDADIFVAKFNKETGNDIWAKSFGGTDYNGSTAVRSNSSGDLYVAGSFFGTIDLNGNTFTAGSNLNSFILKLNATGGFVWAKEIDGSGWNNTYGIATDTQGNCVITGYFIGSATLGATVLQASGNEDIFLAKYSVADGNLQWAKKAGGAGYDNGKAITRDNAGNFYISGHFTGPASFGDKDVTSAINNRDIFVAKYNSDGGIQWIKTAGGAESDNSESIAVGPTGIVHTTGSYRDFSITLGATVLQNSGGDDAFLWKIWQD